VLFAHREKRRLVGIDGLRGRDEFHARRAAQKRLHRLGRAREQNAHVRISATAIRHPSTIAPGALSPPIASTATTYSAISHPPTSL
jgi:hypothetical protein